MKCGSVEARPLRSTVEHPSGTLPCGPLTGTEGGTTAHELTAEDRPDRVRLIAGDDEIGANSGTYVRAILGTQKDRGPGDEVRAALPGKFSTRFSVIACRCVRC